MVQVKEISSSRIQKYTCHFLWHDICIVEFVKFHMEFDHTPLSYIYYSSSFIGSFHEALTIPKTYNPFVFIVDITTKSSLSI
jgi:hypothetical protein